MKRKRYFDYIEEQLHILAHRINTRAKQNLLELNIHAENIYCNLLNIIFDLELKNLNSTYGNVEGIDLIDYKNKVLVQISSTCTKQKIENSLSKTIYSEYTGYRYIFFSISKEISKTIREHTFNNPFEVRINSKEDFISYLELLNLIKNSAETKLKTIYEYIKNELGQEINLRRVESNLANIINVLAKEKFDEQISSPEINSFAIDEKISFNELECVQEIIDDYKVFYHRLDAIYLEFDKEGANKSFSVLQGIRRHYIRLKKLDYAAEEIFYEIIDSVVDSILKSSNYLQLPKEELQMCADILVVDALIRCKIFENPKGYNYVIT